MYPLIGLGGLLAYNGVNLYIYRRYMGAFPSGDMSWNLALYGAIPAFTLVWLRMQWHKWRRK